MSFWCFLLRSSLRTSEPGMISTGGRQAALSYKESDHQLNASPRLTP